MRLAQYLRAKAAAALGKRATLPPTIDIAKPLQEAAEQVAKESGVKGITSSDTPDVLRVGPAGRKLIADFEGCELTAYLCPAGVWTIGYGSTRINGRRVRKGDQITLEQAEKLLDHDIERHAHDVRAAIGRAPTTQGQFDALVSFHYNTGKIFQATLTKLHKRGHYEAAANEFAKWKYAGGRVLKGLVRRRREEAKLYRS